MNGRPANHGVERHLWDGRYSLDRMVVDMRAKLVGQELQVPFDALSGLNTGWIESCRECARAQKVFDDTLGEVANAVNDLNQVSLVQGGRRRDSLVHVQVFPRNPSEIHRLPIDRRTLEYEMLLDRARQSDNATIVLEAEKFQATLDRFREASAARRQTLINEASAYRQLQVGKVRWVAALRHAYHQLRDLAPDDRDWVESFFVVWRRNGGKAKAEAKAPKSPATGTDNTSTA